MTTHEHVKLNSRIAGHIGIKSYYTRKGVVMLAGLQIDPGWDGVLVLGLYNAAPRSLTLEYQATFCTVEFYRLAVEVKRPFQPGREQKEGQIPRADKDYLRTLEAQSLSELGRSLKTLTEDVVKLSEAVKGLRDSQRTTQWVMGIGFAVLAVAIAVVRVIH